MKPRTFRRIVLLGSLCAITLAVVFGYFVVRPWQNQRQLEAMRSNGVAAYEDGDFVNAVRFLGRYSNNAESVDPDILLKLARARVKVQAEDGGHVAVAINVYREYLRTEPGDTEAALELLPLMNERGMYIEARSLAEGLLKDQAPNDINVIRELRYALYQLQASDDELEPVYRAAFEHELSDYNDMNVYFGYLESRGRGDERDSLLAERMERFPGRVDEQVYQFRIDASKLENEDNINDALNNELCSIIGLDPSRAQWEAEAPALSSSVAWEVSRMFNIFVEHRNSTAVLIRSAMNNPEDYRCRILGARSLYWAGDDESLAGLRINTVEGEPDADVLGYRYLAALRQSDQDSMAQIKEEMGTIVLDWRAKAWRNFIEGEEAFRGGDSVAARIAVQKAIDAYRSEPTFHLLMGDVQMKQGRFNEAIELWTLSSELANGKVGIEDPANSAGWTTPMIRVIDAYSAQRRLAEADIYIRELGRLGQRDSQAAFKLLEAKATLARMGELSEAMGLEFVERWRENREDVAPELRALLAPKVATILATRGHRDEAHDELLSAIEHAADEDKLLIDIIDVDARYELGVAAEAGIDTRLVGVDTLEGALRIANRVSQEQQSTDAGLRYLDKAMANMPEEELDAWKRARVGFFDARNDPRALSGWEELLAANSQDVELHYRAAESNAFSKDLARVNTLIDRITELTQTSGKTLTSRLRLARANAIVGNIQNRTNRERALEIVRSVVSTEPNNTKARNMLGRLLALPPTPGLPENEQYKRDFQGAIDQYTTLARQLNSQSAQNYLLVASDLAFEMGDEEQARAILNEFTSRFATDWRMLSAVAERYENMGQLQRASEIYSQVARNFPAPDVLLAFADLQLRMGNTATGIRILQGFREQQGLTLDQVLRLAILYARAGNHSESEEIARNGDRFGLEPFEAKMLLARYARTNLTVEDQIRALQEATSLDPENTLPWRQLIQRLIELNRFEEARASYEQASNAIPNDETIERLGVLSLGEPVTGEDLLQMPGIKDNPRMEEAVKQVNAYTLLPDDAPLSQREQMLAALIDGYPDMEAVQSYAVIQLSSLQIDPRSIANHAERALKNAKGNTRIMGIAGESAILSNQPDLAIRMVQLWRANSLESSIVAEAITARALIQLGQFQEAADLLSAYVDEAYQAPDLPVHREVLDAFCFTRLKVGEDPAVTAARLEPLMKDNQAIRNQIWLDLAANAVNDPAIGAAWIEQATQAADLEADDDRFAIGQAWVRLAMVHQVWDREYAQRAIELLTPLVERPEPSALPLRVISMAYAILGRSQQSQDLGSDDFARAVEFQLRAADLDKGNLSPLLEAAQLCFEGGLHEQAKMIYERLLSESFPEGDFKASLMNNLAMTMLRIGVAATEHDQLLGYVEESTRMAPNVPTFWGTRGWVELELGDATAAERSFRTLIGLSPESGEGWTGLAIALKMQGPDQTAELESALAKLRQIHANTPLEAELLQQLTSKGLGSWSTPGSP